MECLLAQVGDDRQQAFLRSLNETSGASVDSRWLAVGLAVVVIAMVVGVLIQKRKRVPVKASRKYLRNPKKLMKEMAGALDLSSAEVRKLEHHAERMGVENPMTLLICPSLLKKKPEEKS